MSKTKAGRGGAGSVRELGRLTGKSHSAVRKWLADERWTFGTGPWSAATVEKIKAWAAMTLAPNPAAAPVAVKKTAGELEEMSKERLVALKLKHERAEMVKAQREILMGKYHRVDECERRNVRKVHAVRDALMNVAAGLPFEQNVKDEVHRRLREICRVFAGEVPIG